VPLLAAHMFVFHFGTDADITPPVALAAYAGAAIAKSNPLKTSIIATKLAIAGYILPFFFVFTPEMLFQVWNEELQMYVFGADPLKMVEIIVTCLLGMFAISIAAQGFLLSRLSVPWRLLAIVAGFILINPGLLADLIGAGFIALIVILQILRKRREEAGAKLTG